MYGRRRSKRRSGPRIQRFREISDDDQEILGSAFHGSRSAAVAVQRTAHDERRNIILLLLH